MRIYISIVLLGMLIYSCESKIDFMPHAIDHENDICAKCMMKISEDHFVVQAMNKNGEVKFFDDFGCYVKYSDGALWKRFSHNESPKVWITDAETGEWLEIEKAFFDYGVKSPMNFGFGALKNNADGRMNFETARMKIKAMNFKKYLPGLSDSLAKDAIMMENEKNENDSEISIDEKELPSRGKCGEGKCGVGKCGG